MTTLKLRIRKLTPRPLRKLIKRLIRGNQFDEVAIVHQVITSRNCRYANTGVMIDVGAHFGTTAETFLRSGWNVYAFEPDADNREILEGVQARYSKLRIDARAVSDTDGQEMPFYRSDVSTGISGLSAFHETHTQAGMVTTVSLAHFCEENKIENVDFLKIDVEGFDLFVLQGFDWESITPSVIVCEFEDRKTRPLGYTFTDLAGFLANKGYEIAVSEWQPIVEYGQRHKWNRLFSYPGDLENKDGWGNLIAFQSPQCFRQFTHLASRYAPK